MKLHFIVLVSFSDSNFSFFGIHVAVASSIVEERAVLYYFLYCTVLLVFSTIDICIFGPPSLSASTVHTEVYYC